MLEVAPDLRLAGKATLRRPQISSLLYEQVPEPLVCHLSGKEIMTGTPEPLAAL